MFVRTLCVIITGRIFSFFLLLIYMVHRLMKPRPFPGELFCYHNPTRLGPFSLDSRRENISTGYNSNNIKSQEKSEHLSTF